MSSDVAIAVRGVSKCYPVYERPADRLKQFVYPRLQRAFGLEPRRYYREYWALRRVDFEVQRGEQLGIVGRNGAGKSTLLQVICGTLSPTTGQVEVKGRVAALLELGAGFNPELTGRENVFLNGSVLGLDRETVEARYDDIVAFADIPGLIDQPVKSYSSGMFMRLAFSVAVHVEPDVLVVDEALSVGDEAYQRKCHARIRALRDRGTTILFVSHSAGHVTEVCDRALLIDRGEMLCIGRAKDVVSRYQKMLYAPVDRQEAVRESIRSGCADPVPAQRRADEIRVDDAWWDPSLVPQSTVGYPGRGCSISDARIETVDGYRVNVLRPLDEYVYAYTVDFSSPAAGVRFGMMIRSLTGVELAGAVSHAEDDPLDHVPSGSRVHVRFRFRNLLNAGTYFLNAGVAGLEGENETFLARQVDLAMFRVPREGGRRVTGFADFGAVAALDIE
jgi:lipopolysaccharide transport system ATP-binding protein